MNRGCFLDYQHGGTVLVLGRMLLLSVEIELRSEPHALLSYKGGPEFPGGIYSQQAVQFADVGKFFTS